MFLFRLIGALLFVVVESPNIWNILNQSIWWQCLHVFKNWSDCSPVLLKEIWKSPCDTQQQLTEVSCDTKLLDYCSFSAWQVDSCQNPCQVTVLQQFVSVNRKDLHQERYSESNKTQLNKTQTTHYGAWQQIISRDIERANSACSGRAATTNGAKTNNYSTGRW